MAFLGKHFIFIICFLKLKSNFTCVFICFLICQSTFLSYYFSAPNIFQGFSSIFARTSGRAADKLLNGSRVSSHRQFVFRNQGSSLFRCNTTFRQNRSCNFSHFLVMVKTGLFYTFFRKSELLTIKVAS